jgi:Tfp pilus assembly protein PilO
VGSTNNRMIVAILALVALAVAFWMLALSPKRQEASDLAAQADDLRASLVTAQAQVAEGLIAKREFPNDYEQLVVLGKAVPGDDDTSSLLVEVNRISSRSNVTFQSIQLSASASSATPAAAPVATPAPTPGVIGAVPAAATVPPTEAAAALLPLGASIGSAGLGVMPYDLSFTGDFFRVADFIQGMDSLIHTGGREVAVDGRLVTINGFALNASSRGFSQLNATFSVTTYLVPPDQGLTAGASQTAPAPAVAAPVSTTPAPIDSTSASTTTSSAR